MIQEVYQILVRDIFMSLSSKTKKPSKMIFDTDCANYVLRRLFKGAKHNFHVVYEGYANNEFFKRSK